MTSRIAYNLERTTDPTEEPIDKSSAKLQCHIEAAETFFDNWFDGDAAVDAAGAIPAARFLVEQDAQVALMPQTWQLRLDNWPIGKAYETSHWDVGARHMMDTRYMIGDDWIDLLIHPVQSVTVSYEDTNDATQTWAASNYELQVSKYRSILMKTDKDVDFPTLSTSDPRPITITITAGYSNTTDQATIVLRRAKVPPSAKMAMLMLIAHWFRNKESVLVGSISKEIEQGYKSLIRTIRPERYA